MVFTVNSTEKRTIIVNGYCYPSVDREVLSQSLDTLTYLSIFSYQVRADGSLVAIDDTDLIQDAINHDAAPKMVITNILEGGNFDSTLGHTILSNQNIQDTLLENCLAVMKEKGYVGLDVDFEYLYPADRELYNAFLQKASSVLHANNYVLSTAIAPKLSADQKGTLYEAHDYYAHGQYADLVIIMTYEWGYLYGPPMAVAPLNQVRRVLDYAVTVIPSEKILMGIPNYGYDWTLPYVHGSAATTLNNLEAVALAVRMGAVIQFDELSQSPFFTYFDSKGAEHIVWFEDERSIAAKLLLVEEYNLGGISYWTVNQPFPQNWELINSMFDVKKLPQNPQ